MAEQRKKIDWEKIEEAYRAGNLSLREIASSHGITHGAINKRAKRDNWERDLSHKIKAKADSLVSKAEVSKKVSTISEKDIVDANAQSIMEIRLAHRSDIRRAKGLVSTLFEEVESARLIDGQERKGEILTIPQRVDCVRKLTDSAKVLIGLEREAWGVKDDDSKNNPSGLSVYITPLDELL